MKKILLILAAVFLLLIGCPQDEEVSASEEVTASSSSSSDDGASSVSSSDTNSSDTSSYDASSSSDSGNQEVTYTIQFNSNGGEGSDIEAMVLKNGEKKSLPACSYTKQYHVFEKWTTEQDGSGTTYLNRQSVSNLTTENNAVITLYAQWKLIQYNIIFDNNGGNGSIQKMVLEWDETATLPKCTFTKKGYKFNEWNTKKNGSETSYQDEESVVNLSSENKKNITLYAQWKPITYKIHFDNNGGEGSMLDLTVDYNQTKVLPSNQFTAQSGKYFSNWSLNQDGTGKIFIEGDNIYNLSDIDNEVITFYAQWLNDDEYAILYHDEQNANNPNPVKYTVLDEIILQDLSADKYVFLGWYDTSGDISTGNKITSWAAGSKSGTVHLWAKWESNIKLFDIGSLPNKLEYEKGESLNLSGLSGIGLYEDNSTKWGVYSDESENFVVADITALDVGKHDVVCLYKGLEFTISISVIKARDQKNWWEEADIPSDYALNHDFWDNANVYFVLIDRFYNGDTNNDTSYGRVKGTYNSSADATKYYGGDIKGLTQKLDYLANTGINAIWITAPYEQIHGWVGGSYPYHGYWTLDWTQMDASVGTAEEFRTFVDTAHEKGIRVVMDIVMNHPGYATLVDLKNLVSSGSVGVLKRQDIENADPDSNKKPNYHDIYIDYKSCEWHDWWGVDWVRAGFCQHYTTGTGDLQGEVPDSSLPDFITESGKGVSLSPMFTRKLADTTSYPREGYKVTDLTNDASEAGNYRMRDYLIKWLSDWVREFGIDGFRCDTAKHVEKEAWYQLKVACIKALRDWKTANPTKKVDDSDFWMTGEVFGHDVEKDDYFTDGGFDSLINFAFKDKVNKYFTNISGVDAIYSSYASKINTDEDFNMLTYISSHDTTLCYSYYAETVANQKMSGSLLAFCPGAIQIYYGDECGRKKSSSSDAEQQTRSQMPWNEDGYRSAQLGYDFDSDIHAHWSKVLNFRKNHVAVGAGAHAKIADTPYTFSRVKGSDKVIVVLGASGSVEVDVSSVFENGTTLHNGEETATVANGKVTFTADSNGVILID